MSVSEAIKSFDLAKKVTEACQQAFVGLEKRCDELQTSFPSMREGIEKLEKEKTDALAEFALNGDANSEAALKEARTALAAAQREFAESNELVEAIGKSLKRKQVELGRLHQAQDICHRQIWKAIFDEVQADISDDIFEDFKKLLIVGAQYSKTRQGILQDLLPQPAMEDFQKICKEMKAKYKFDV